MKGEGFIVVMERTARRNVVLAMFVCSFHRQHRSIFCLVGGRERKW